MAIAVGLTLLGVLAFPLVRKARFSICCLVLFVLLPFQLFESFHPVFPMAVLGLLFIAVRHGPIAARVVRDVWPAAVLLSLAGAAVAISASSFGGVYRYAAFLVVGPICVFLLVRVQIQADPSAESYIHRWVVALAALESALALAQYVSRSAIVYGSVVSSSSASVNGGQWRSPGTFDHPLLLAFFLAGAIPLIFQLIGPVQRYLLLALLLSGILCTESRSGLLAGLALAGVLVWRTSRNLSERIGVLSLSGISVLFLLLNPVGTGVLGRFADDSGSSAARDLGRNAFDSIVGSRTWSGSGLGSSYGVADSLGLYSSFENSFFMLVIDVGLAGAVALYIAQVFLVLRHSSRVTIFGPRLGAVACLFLTFSFSSVATITAGPFVLWLYIAVGSANMGSVHTHVMNVKARSSGIQVAEDQVSARVAAR